MKYSEKLKDPRWQKKRLQIMRRDNFQCAHCGCNGKMLHVHHKYYENGNEPWEYANNALITLCEKCHNEEPRAKVIMIELLTGAINKLSAHELDIIKTAVLFPFEFCKVESIVYYEALLDFVLGYNKKIEKTVKRKINKAKCYKKYVYGTPCGECK